MSARKPVPARMARPIPRVDQLAAAGVALGAVALGGCKNPFEGGATTRDHRSFADLRPDLVDPGESLASMFATSAAHTATHDEHLAYPLAAVAAVAATRFVHAVNAEPLPPAPKSTGAPTTTFMGGAMAVYTPRPVHARGAIRSVHSTVASSGPPRRRP
jgi:hypothetical protein